MGWEAFGAIAEIVSAVAVLVTLIYLALQIRQNSHSIDQQNAIAKSQSLQQRADSVTQLSALTLGSEENVAVYTKLLSNKAIRPADLEPNERMRAALILHALRANLENTFLQYQEGFLSESFYREVAVQLFAIYGHLFFAFDMPLEKTFRKELSRILMEQNQQDDS